MHLLCLLFCVFFTNSFNQKCSVHVDRRNDAMCRPKITPINMHAHFIKKKKKDCAKELFNKFLIFLYYFQIHLFSNDVYAVL